MSRIGSTRSLLLVEGAGLCFSNGGAGAIGGRRESARSDEVVAAEFADEGGSGDAEDSGGSGFVSAGGAEGFAEGLDFATSFGGVVVGCPGGSLAFGGARWRVGVGGRGRGVGGGGFVAIVVVAGRRGWGSGWVSGSEGLGEVAGGDARSVGEDDGALDDVFEFSDVSGPVVFGEESEGGVVEAFEGFGEAVGVSCEEVSGEVEEVGASFAEGRHAEFDDVEAVVEVLAESVLSDEGGEVAVGGGDDADIDADGSGASDEFEGFLLEDAEELDLDVGGDVADFVEEEGSAVGLLEASDAVAVGAGEGALDVSEEFAFEECGG